MDRNVPPENAVFVSHEWIETSDEVVPVDVRTPEAYRDGHVPAAANVPFDSFRDDGGGDVGKLPGADRFASLVGERGIAPGDTLVAYDDAYGVYAARFLVTALAYGHRNVHVADGDFAAWEVRHPTTDAVPERDPTTYPAHQPDERPVLDGEAFAAVVESDAAIVDTRIEYEYRVAHVPGAIQLNWRRFVDDETRRLRPTEEIRRLLAGRGISPDRPVALYCNTARRLSFVYAVLGHLGYEDVLVYEGGLSEWAEAGGDVRTAN